MKIILFLILVSLSAIMCKKMLQNGKINSLNMIEGSQLLFEQSEKSLFDGMNIVRNSTNSPLIRINNNLMQLCRNEAQRLSVIQKLDSTKLNFNGNYVGFSFKYFGFDDSRFRNTYFCYIFI